MQETWKEMFQFLQGYYNNGIILYIYIASLLMIMLFGGKRLRKLIGWPVLALMVIVFNPVFYRYVWQKCFHYGYWRVFWLFPFAIVISVAMIALAGKIRQRNFRALCLILMLILIGTNGKNMFSKQMFYTSTQNIYKLPQKAIDVSDALLELDAEPKVVMCSELYSYIRQYSTDIKMMYGRNVEGYIDGWNEKSIDMSMNLQQLDGADWTRVAELMRQEKCKYLIIPENGSCSKENMKQYSFVLIKQVDGYNIFKLD